jgi:hypothetical protein
MGKLPKCKLYEDTHGSWEAVPTTEEARKEFDARHFFHGGGGYAYWFDKIWVPSTCSYHRFTNETLYKCIDYQLESRRSRIAREKNETAAAGKKKSPRRSKEEIYHDTTFELNLMGDSALRGITCGITRIVEGNEYEGPCDNVVCGGTGHLHPLSAGNAFGHPFSIDYSPLLKVTFTYVTTFFYQHFDWLLEWEVSANKPNVLIMNTGAWDFDSIAREMNERNVYAAEDGECRWKNETEVSIKRASQWVDNVIVHEYGAYAKSNDVRLIYRGNHYNARFGPHCADTKLQKLFEDDKAQAWEVWDNARISKDAWKAQTWDGFHFDRNNIHSTEQHLYNVAQFGGAGREKPGAMEMQLAHSLLNSVFHECLTDHPDFAS